MPSSLNRYPKIYRTFALTSETTTAANAFGGYVSITVPSGANAGKVSVTVSNVVVAPEYTLGSTDLALWNSTIRLYDAPSAMLISPLCMLCVPGSWVRQLGSPDKTMAMWNQVVAYQKELAQEA